MKFEDQLGIAYFVVFGLVALANWLFMRRLTPSQKHRRYPKAALLSILVLSPFFLVFALQDLRIDSLVITVAALVFIGYLSVAIVRVCQSCGHVTQPEGFFAPAKFCSKCGSAVTPSPLFPKSKE
jgi:protein-S-isoprenylcysteine O-methyltransferase Ste14